MHVLPFRPRTMERCSKSSSPQPLSLDTADINELLCRRNQTGPTVCRMDRVLGHTHELAVLTMSDSTRLWVRFPASSSSRLLRHEDPTLHNDLDVIHLLAQTEPKLNMKLVTEDLTGTCFGKPCLVTTDVPGVPLSTIASSINSAERGRIHFSVGSWLANTAPMNMPQFGIAQQLRARHGQVSWRRVFCQLMQGALMDAEDALLNLPYHRIMQLLHDKGNAFDRVKSASLSFLDAGDERKILVDPDTRTITGLLGLSNAAWGDPLIARCFMWPENTDALAGFGIQTVSDEHSNRLLLYTVYHCIVAIVRDTFRPQEELRMPDARRRLHLALQELESP